MRASSAAVLARAFGDPSLEVGYWLEESSSTSTSTVVRSL